MKALAEFLKTTLIGGLLVVVPIYFTALLLAKALAGLVALLAPITSLLPDELHHFRGLAAIALLVLASFLLGLLARTAPGRWLVAAFERHVLERIPGYSLLRGVTRRVSGLGDDAMFQPVLVEI
jgi:uncharacterized membrane protein